MLVFIPVAEIGKPRKLGKSSILWGNRIFFECKVGREIYLPRTTRVPAFLEGSSKPWDTHIGLGRPRF